MSGTSMNLEFERLVEGFGYGLDDLQWFTINALKSAFIPFDERLELIDGVVKPGYAILRALDDGADVRASDVPVTEA
jgi:adenosine deaminase